MPRPHFKMLTLSFRRKRKSQSVNDMFERSHSQNSVFARTKSLFLPLTTISSLQTKTTLQSHNSGVTSPDRKMFSCVEKSLSTQPKNLIPKTITTLNSTNATAAQTITTLNSTNATAAQTITTLNSANATTASATTTSATTTSTSTTSATTTLTSMPKDFLSTPPLSPSKPTSQTILSNRRHTDTPYTPSPAKLTPKAMRMRRRTLSDEKAKCQAHSYSLCERSISIDNSELLPYTHDNNNNDNHNNTHTNNNSNNNNNNSNNNTSDNSSDVTIDDRSPQHPSKEELESIMDLVKSKIILRRISAENDENNLIRDAMACRSSQVHESELYQVSTPNKRRRSSNF